jgi:hypothetical protein
VSTIIYQANDNLIEVLGLQDYVTGSYGDGSASVHLTAIKDSLGNVVTGVTFPIVLAYVTSSNGDYRGVVDKNLALLAESSYTAIIDATIGTLDAHWELPLVCKVRTS